MVLEHLHLPEVREARLAPERTHLFDLRATVESLRSETQYITRGRNGITLVKNPELRVVLEVLRHGAHLLPHRAPGPITVQVLEGEIEFAVGFSRHSLQAGDLLVVPSRKLHSVWAIRGAAFLLTIAVEPKGFESDPEEDAVCARGKGNSSRATSS